LFQNHKMQETYTLLQIFRITIQKNSLSYSKPTFPYNQGILLRYSMVLLFQTPLHLSA
jgi:hypothetical protein